MGRHRRWAGLAALVASAGVLGGTATATPALAHEGDESVESSELVLQAIGLLVNRPGDAAAAEERINDALEAEDTEGVDLGDVRDAKAAVVSGDNRRARMLLARAIGAKPNVIRDPLAGRGALEPGDWLLLVGSIVVGALGAVLPVRSRPTTARAA